MQKWTLRHKRGAVVPILLAMIGIVCFGFVIAVLKEEWAKRTYLQHEIKFEERELQKLKDAENLPKFEAEVAVLEKEAAELRKERSQLYRQMEEKLRADKWLPLIRAGDGRALYFTKDDGKKSGTVVELETLAINLFDYGDNWIYEKRELDLTSQKWRKSGSQDWESLPGKPETETFKLLSE